MSLRYMPHIMYSLALTSFSMHLLYERRATDEDRAHYSGKISILETLVQNLEQGRTMDPREVERLRKLAGFSTSHVPEIGKGQSRIRWKEVLLGKTPAEQALNGSVARDQGDWEKRRWTPIVICSLVAYRAILHVQSKRKFAPRSEAGLPSPPWSGELSGCRRSPDASI